MINSVNYLVDYIELRANCDNNHDLHPHVFPQLHKIKPRQNLEKEKTANPASSLQNTLVADQDRASGLEVGRQQFSSQAAIKLCSRHS